MEAGENDDSVECLSNGYLQKHVIQLQCKVCENFICYRGMRAILLADMSVELFSTDLPPYQAVELVGRDYSTANCECRIRDVACGACGERVGYHVTLPCQCCLSSNNNGHFWMFHSDASLPSPRTDQRGEIRYNWTNLPSVSDDPTVNPPSQAQPQIPECFR
ncbi:protein FAM72A-like [Sycon ciliatum]|uniref:protein FAM72A-like n=1 Tax=Sycon ciliatum TaxID=27933 RepID=UPI0020ABE80B